MVIRSPVWRANPIFGLIRTAFIKVRDCIYHRFILGDADKQNTVDMKNILLGLALSFSAANSLAGSEVQSLENISQELVNIRQQIETLHNQISYAKAAYKDQMRSYSNQKSDLDVRISRADLNIKDLQRELKKLTDSGREKSRSKNDITPVLKQAIVALRNSISTSLPFKLDQRLSALNEIGARLDANLISPNKAANQLWAFVEDELMLGKSSGIYNDTLYIDGQDKLVKVLRIGKIAMFYKTHDGHFGVIQKQGEHWQQRPVDTSDNVALLDKLFDSFSKNIRNGQFTTPNFLPRS